MTALDFTRALLPHMPGWQLDDDTRRMIAESDDRMRHWAGITTLGHPGSDVTVNTSHAGPERLRITARYPKDWEPWIDRAPGQSGGRRYVESITVSAAKTPEQIAKDIERRLFIGTGYLARLAECQQRRAASERALDDGAALAENLAAVMGVQTQYERYKNVRNCSHLTSDNNRLAFDYHDDTHELRIEGKAAHGGKSVDLKLENLTPAQAGQLLMLCRTYIDGGK